MDDSFAASVLDHQSTVHDLRLAVEARNLSNLVALLDPSVAMAVDSGGKVPADRRIVRGRARVAERACALLENAPVYVTEQLDITEQFDITEQQVNGQSGLVLRRKGRVCGVVSVNVRNGLVTDLWIVLNPDKLRHWNQPST